jgi:DNA-directed RNA polymerase subunit K/omega
MVPKLKKSVQINELVKDNIKIDKKKLFGGLEVKDNPDKIDKKDFDSNEEEEIDEDEEENEEIVSEEETEEETEIEEKEKDEAEGDDEEGGADDECVYKITKKKKEVDIELNVGDDTFDEEEPKKIDIQYVKPEERITKPYLFEFERVRILGERAKQISMGAKPMIKNVDNLDPKSIARLELENKVIPLMILRELPDRRIEKWKISELA